PYSWFRSTWGGGGRSKTEVGYTRNINPRWNFGGNYKSYLADKQVQKLRRGDRNVESIGYNFFTSYRSKNEKYWLFSSFDRTKHQQFEQGGLSVSDSSNIDLFFSDYVGTFMSTAKSIFFKNNVHLYHDYRLSEFFRFFHTLDREKRTASFTADQTSDDINFFDNIEIVSLKKEEEDFNKFTELNNRLGVNGAAKNFYYSAYIQRRDIKMEYQWMNTDSLGIKTKNAEHYAGFESGWKVKDLFIAQIEGKVMLNGGSQFKGEVSSKWLEGKASRTVYLPSFYQYAYRGHYDYWNFNYDLSTHTHYNVTGILGVKGITLKPHFEYNIFDNYIAFKKINNIKGAQNVFPIQGNGYIMTAIPGVSLELKYKKLTYEGTIKNIQQFGESAFLMPMPEWYLWSRLTLHSFFFKDNLEIQAGVQVHWKSDFYAMAYDPAIQQFYVQNEFLVKNYWLTGVFMNAKVKRGLIFIRFNNLRQLLNPTGYISTPYYRGEGPLFDFGFKLPFYD
ncbi:MAG: putative porin, partial [Cyclobacteriaceae bacterium]|nr:putative porin [Cyclobacteriaceae bacterium]